MELKVEYNALTEAPVWESHQRGKNWFAKIAIDPASPGGLKRDFAPRAKGEYFYLVPSWAKVGTPVEFGADYYSCRGSKNARRWYGIITEVHDDKIVLVECGTGKAAVKQADEMGKQNDSWGGLPLGEEVLA